MKNQESKSVHGVRCFHVVLAASLCFTALTVAGHAEGADPTQCFEEANRAYASGDFAEAISRYRATMDLAGVSPNLLYNLGNAYYQSGDVGQAVLNYERALTIAPHDADIQTNLERVRDENGLYQQPLPAWLTPFKKLSLNEWMKLFGLSFSAISLLMLVRGLGFGRGNTDSNPKLRIYVTGMMAGLALLVVSGVGIALRYPEMHDAVVLQARAPLQVSPFEAAEEITPLPAGKVVRLQKTRGDYLFISDGSGRSGWIQAGLVSPVWASNRS